MTKSDAVEIIEMVKAIGEQVIRLHDISEHFLDPLKHEFRRHLAVVIATIYGEILIPVLEKYPELGFDAVELVSRFKLKNFHS
jgi:hypothetical protein